MMFADDTAEGWERTNDMLRRRGLDQDEIDMMMDYED